MDKLVNFIKTCLKFILKLAPVVLFICANIWFIKSPLWDKFINLEIVKSNALSFLVVISILLFIIYKVQLSQKLQDGVDKVKETIDNSTSALEKSKLDLDETKQIVSHVEDEIKKIVDLSEKNVLNQEEKIINDTKKEVEKFGNNAENAVKTKEKELIDNLSGETILASIELAKKHIINLLEKNPGYHEKFIDDSIRELDRLK